jgi:hypothetical protein
LHWESPIFGLERQPNLGLQHHIGSTIPAVTNDAVSTVLFSDINAFKDFLGTVGGSFGFTSGGGTGGVGGGGGRSGGVGGGGSG